MALCDAFVRCLCAMPLCNALCDALMRCPYARCLYAMPLCNALVRCLRAMPLCNALVRCPCAMPLCDALVNCSCVMLLCGGLMRWSWAVWSCLCCFNCLFLAAFRLYGFDQDGYKCKLKMWPLWLDRTEDCPQRLSRARLVL